MAIIVDDTGGGRTFVELQDEALHDDFDPTKYRPLAKRFLNEALRRMARRVRIPELESTQDITTAAGVAEVALDAGVARVNSLRNLANGAPLDPVAIADIDELAGQGKPSVYAHVGRRLALGPTPDGGYELQARVQGLPAFLDSDDATPELVDDYRDLLVTYARSRLFRLEDDLDMARAYMQDFEAGLVDYAGDVMFTDRSRVRQVGDRRLRRAGPRVSRP